MSNHTPGPWIARKGDVLNPDRPWGIVTLLSKEECEAIDGDTSAYGNRTTVITEVCGAESDAIAESDARLIAAAPDMLAVLRMAMESLDACPPPEEWDCRSVIRAAILKAEGRA